VSRGMCAIAAAYGGVVEDHSERGEAGVVDVHRLRPADGNSLFGDAPETFRAVAHRNDDIMQLPVQCVPMANTKLSQFHIIKVAGKNVYGTQFDPLLSMVSEELKTEERERMKTVLSTWLAFDAS
jgi:GMP synthase-like glutamine amidotransferase